MTDDLVSRLRSLAGRTVDLPTHYEMTEAADRIELLEYALRSIAEVPIGAEIPDRTTIWGLATYMRETATDALKETKHEERSTQL
jgi:hypothetical protein